MNQALHENKMSINCGFATKVVTMLVWAIEQNRKLRTIWRLVWFEEDNHIPFTWVPLHIVTCCSYSSMSRKRSGLIRSRFTNTPLSKCLRCLLFIFRVIFCAWKKLSCPNWETEGAVCEEGVAWPDRKHHLIFRSLFTQFPLSGELLSIPQVDEFNLVLLRWQNHKRSNPWIKNSYSSR